MPEENKYELKGTQDGIIGYLKGYLPSGERTVVIEPVGEKEKGMRVYGLYHDEVTK